jgi:hypothetical protein
MPFLPAWMGGAPGAAAPSEIPDEKQNHISQELWYGLEVEDLSRPRKRPSSDGSSSTPPTVSLTQEQLETLLSRAASPPQPALPPAMPPSIFPQSYESSGTQIPNVRRIIGAAEIATYLPAPTNEVEFVPTVDAKESKRLIRERELLRNRVFSTERILADRTALAGCKKTQRRLIEEYHQSIATEKELISLEPDRVYCETLRMKSTYAEKMNRWNLDARLAKENNEVAVESEAEPPAFSTLPGQFPEDHELRRQFEAFMLFQTQSAQSTSPTHR